MKTSQGTSKLSVGNQSGSNNDPAGWLTRPLWSSVTALCREERNAGRGEIFRLERTDRDAPSAVHAIWLVGRGQHGSAQLGTLLQEAVLQPRVRG